VSRRLPGQHEQLRKFRAAYAQHRAAEGRAANETELLSLPYLRHGPLARQWRVRARSFDRFVESVVEPRAREVFPRRLHVLDLGAGNGWLSYRVTLLGHRAWAVDIRDDSTDGLGAAGGYARHLPFPFDRVVASFEELPFARPFFDVVVFNAAIHYALDLAYALQESARVLLPAGRIAILDSPFYARRDAGDAMVAEKRRTAVARFGKYAQDLLALPVVEYLTATDLAHASEGLGLRWQRHRVRYPLWYELRPVLSALRGHREPSRFDVWEAIAPR
jgi:SAM-dependent methyltransferase